MGPSGAASCSAKGFSGGICGQEEEEKEAYPPAGTSLQVQTDRRNSPCKEIPADVLLRPLAQRDGLCGQFHVVYPGRYSCGSVSAVFTCEEKAYIAKQKKRHG